MDDVFAQKIKEYIGSPEGLGRPDPQQPVPGAPIKRRVFTDKGTLEEREVVLSEWLGSGLSAVVYKGVCGGETITEKFTADLQLKGTKKKLGKSLMEFVFFVFRQSLPSFRTNFYAAMSNHYANLIISDASEFEFGYRLIPRIRYTSYDALGGGYLMAYEYIDGRFIRPDREEDALRKNLEEWKPFISGKLGLWGIARQADVNNVNSPGNVLVTDEDNLKMRLIDITPGVLGGQIWLLPLETEYFFKGLFSGNFLPFGDAVDIRRLNRYCDDIAVRLAGRLGTARIGDFAKNCAAFEFYLKKWRDSEPRLLSSPARIPALFFNMRVIRATLDTAVTEMEYRGLMSTAAALEIREKVRAADKRRTLFFLRIIIFSTAFIRAACRIPRMIYGMARSIFFSITNTARATARFFKFLAKIYTDAQYRQKVSKEKINEWITAAEEKEKSITKSRADSLRRSLEDVDILQILQIGPLWALAKVIKPPFVGTATNIASFFMLINTLNPLWLIPMFIDGIIRFAIAVFFTGFRYRMLLFLSLVPTFGFIVPIPAQLMKNAPQITEFLMKQVAAVKIGTSVPGIDKHSFRTYFYMRLMDIPLYFMRILARFF